jgi:CDP-paratose 2-epimerase
VAWKGWRPGDQRIYVSDIRKAGRELDWQPKVDVEEGIRRLYGWIVEHLELFEAHES